MASPEELARQNIDALLTQCGWKVQKRSEINLSAGRGIAITEGLLKGGDEADYLLFVDGKAIGTVEAKPEGYTLTGVEEQSGKYGKGLLDIYPKFREPLPFAYESTGVETQFTNQLDPDPKSRNVFAFHKPETLLEWIQSDTQLNSRLANLLTSDQKVGGSNPSRHATFRQFYCLYIALSLTGLLPAAWVSHLRRAQMFCGCGCRSSRRPDHPAL
jgi:type I site-specific restriction endonuclease